MLKFSKQQQALILNARKQHEVQHKIMQANYGDKLLAGNAAPLPRDVWGEWDRESVMIQRDILAVFNDLAAAVSRPMDIGKLVHYFRTASDSGEANISLDGKSSAKTDQQLYAYHGTPLPIIDTTFSYTWRQVRAAQTENENLESDGRDNGMRRIAEKLEDIALNGDEKIVVGDSSLYGLRNHPQRATRATGVVLNGATGAEWKAEIIALLQLLHANNFRAPATVYINWDDWFYANSTDFSTLYPNKTIAQRIMEIGGMMFVPANSVPANEMIAVIKRRDVLQVLNGMPMTTRALFRADPEDDYNFKVMAAAALEIKFDAEEQCGVAHSTGVVSG
jgi:hypothetical protein